MKNIIYLSVIILFYACTAPETVKEETAPPQEEDLAEKYGADDYGMKVYVMAFLKSGPDRSQDSTTAANLQKAHLENIDRMAEEGKLIIAGPFMDDGEIRGIYIFDVETVEEARELTATDPAIQAGRSVMELHPWYGPAALMAIPELYEEMVKVRPSEGG